MKPANSPVDRQTRMAAVVFADLVGFSKKSVPAQLAAKEALTALLEELVTPYPKEGRVVLDTGDGAAVGFLVSPEFALGLALRLRRELVAAPVDALLQSKDLRLGINLGPLKVVTDVNGQPEHGGRGHQLRRAHHELRGARRDDGLAQLPGGRLLPRRELPAPVRAARDARRQARPRARGVPR